MLSGFNSIPGWFSSENQGAGVAIANLSGGGSQDLIVLMVDNPPGQNRGLYRVGKRIAADGAPTNGWTDWMDIPDWFSFENQRAGVAVADLDGDGRPELIVFMIDSPVGQNQGYYRIGRKLDTGGVVTGGWGDWTPVPDWFSFENQHGRRSSSRPGWRWPAGTDRLHDRKPGRALSRRCIELYLVTTRVLTAEPLLRQADCTF